MIVSKIKHVKEQRLPDYQGDQVYMEPIDLALGYSGLERWEGYINSMLESAPKEGTAFLTIDEKLVEASKTHRRGGPHVDGNYLFGWGSGGGNGWLTGHKGRVLSPEKHEKQYCSSLGGMLISSSYKACRAWIGKFKGNALQGGNCAHIQNQLNKSQYIDLEPNNIYLSNSTCVHESMPIKESVFRQLVRITLPPVKIL